MQRSSFKVMVVSFLTQLNAQQKEAVLHEEGPLLILAGAGSGKTKTMAFRIAHLMINRRVPASAILGLSFTNKAARELKERVVTLVNQQSKGRSTQGLWITTFHSLCVRILRAHAGKIGFQPSFSILDQSDQIDVLKQVMKNIRIDDRKFDLHSILFQFGQVKNRLLSQELAQEYLLNTARLPQDYAIAAASSFGRYTEQLKILNALDFDDLIFHTIELLRNHADVRAAYNDRFKFILVDEYQDTNASQFELIRLLTQKQKNICVVGDDDQSIYAWRGADPSHILDFQNQFTGAKVVTLERNYRSKQTILDAANEVIAKNKFRHPKKLWSSQGEGEPIVELIVEDDRSEAKAVSEELFALAQKEPKRPWSDFAILYRSNSQSRVFEEALRTHQIPYKIVGGISFLERKEVKDLLSYWKLIVNPNDDSSLRRIMNWPARGIGKTSIETLSQLALERELSLFSVLKDAQDLPPRAATGAQNLVSLIESLHHELAATPVDPERLGQWAKRSLDRIGAKKALHEEEEDDPAKAARRWENIEELANALGQLRLNDYEEEEKASALSLLQSYLSRLALAAQDEEDSRKDSEAENNQVTLLTLHGAKGLEYPVVFMVGAEDGFLPHQRTLDEAGDISEERRLCYVGITRAKERLFISRAKFRIRYGKQIPRYPSRFLGEIPPHLILTQDESITQSQSEREQQKSHEVRVSNFLADLKGRLAQTKP